MNVRRGALACALAAAAVSGLAACTSSHASSSTATAPSSGTTAAATPSVAAPVSTSAGAPTVSSTRSAGAAAPATVPAPTPGNIHQTIASRAIHTRPPVALHRPASFGTGVTVRLVSAKAINATAHGPGEIGGPAVELSLQFTNSGARPVSLASVVVNVYDSDHDPASTIAGPPAHPVSGSLAAHRSTVGRYVFTVAPGKRKPITISVSYSAAAPVVLIVGDAD